MKAYIAECDPKGHFLIFSDAIKLAQHLPFSHYALIIEDEYGQIKSIDASGRTLHQESLENFKTKYNIIRLYHLPELDKDFPEFRKWFHKIEGQKYGYLQVVGLFLLTLGLTKRNLFSNGTDSIICNEFVLRFLNFQGLIEDSKFDNWDLVRTRELLESKFDYIDGKDLSV